ncbi:helix-turn-helix domain-containing protein [Streptomyces sp. NPDC088732]|uniref:helix-turn-helix domain-containing protein n=1 Tax=Streptomyces sp. NPDC088732 TaxID=3365879 RepID=UPI0037F2F667
MLPDPARYDRFHQVVAGHVRDARLWRNLSQEDLAHAAGVSPRTVVALESGRSGILLDKLLAIADAMQMPLTDLVREPATEAEQPRDDAQQA